MFSIGAAEKGQRKTGREKREKKTRNKRNLDQIKREEGGHEA